jgi:hypothetical protein
MSRPRGFIKWANCPGCFKQVGVMKMKKLIVVTAISLLTTMNANAKEWRQLTETMNYTTADFVANADGIMDGWTWASKPDVQELFDVHGAHIFAILSPTFEQEPDSDTTYFRALMGVTRELLPPSPWSTTRRQAMGVIKSPRYTRYFDKIPRFSHFNRADEKYVGAWMYRAGENAIVANTLMPAPKPVSLPATLLLFIAAIAIFGVFKPAKQRVPGAKTV